MAGNISDQTTDLSNLAVARNLSAGTFTSTGALSNVSSSRGTFANVWATSQVSTPDLRVQGGVLASGKTIDLRTNSVLISTHTRADDSGLTIGQLGLVFQASGVSLVFSSGKSVYIVGQSAVSGAQG